MGTSERQQRADDEAEARYNQTGCNCPPEWRKAGPDAVNRTGHHPDCELEQARVAGEDDAEHTIGNGQRPVHGKQPA